MNEHWSDATRRLQSRLRRRKFLTDRSPGFSGTATPPGRDARRRSPPSAGVNPANMQLAVVVHGQAVKDLVKPAEGAEMTPQMNMISQMLSHGVRFYVCGQSAAYYQVNNEDLLPGVIMSLSAMTVHAQLQQQGYTLNPF